jgi:hypothetical protein
MATDLERGNLFDPSLCFTATWEEVNEMPCSNFEAGLLAFHDL